MNGLYPLKFHPLIKERIWGGSRLKTILHKDTGDSAQTGESWECSGLEENISVVRNGYLEGNNLRELIEVYMGDLLGDRVYEEFGLDFPLLIKFIDAREVLSVQVHPGNRLAAERHGSYGKTEMWYIIEADPGSVVYTGFNREMDAAAYLRALESGQIENILNKEEALPGDVFDIPAGRVHATGGGILLAEIQQASDITYRIHDWNRVDASGKSRELHVAQALEAIDFKKYPVYKSHPEDKPDTMQLIGSSEYFQTSKLHLTRTMVREFHQLDSFLLFLCIRGGGKMSFSVGEEEFTAGETILVPASLEQITISPSPSTLLLEVHIPLK